MYIAVRQIGSDILLEDRTFHIDDYDNSDLDIDEVLDLMYEDIEAFKKEATEKFQDFYFQVID